MILLLVLLTTTLIANESTGSPPSSGNEYGIDLSRSYAGTEVLEIVAVMDQEAVFGIKDAYAEGFKAGKKEEAGQSAYWKTIADQYRKPSKAPPWLLPVASVLAICGSFFGGVATGLAAAR